MKNIQIIDGATNSVFEIYEIPDELFRSMFPDNNDVAFLDDVGQILQEIGGDQVWNLVYKKRVDKKQVSGIHGTLHLTGSYCKKEYFPTRKETEVLTSLK